MENLSDIQILELYEKICPVLNHLIKGNIHITLTSIDRWIAYLGEDSPIKIQIGDSLPYNSNSARCIRENRVVEEPHSDLLGASYLGRAVPIYNAHGNVIGSIGYLTVLAAIDDYDTYSIIVGRNIKMCRIMQDLKKIAKTNTNVMLLGETGTGKDLFANYIHKISKRADRPMMSVNCSAIPRDLFESEMFGYEPGSFTGAKQSGKEGLFELSNGGILYLDEIGDLDYFVQAKLLRVLQTNKVFRIGGKREITIDVRIISATNQDLAYKIFNNSFRRDLYFRLNPIIINIPPLRERIEDLPLLIDHIMKKKSKEFGKNNLLIEAGALNELLQHDYPGNIRELENVIHRSIIMSENDIIEESCVRDAIESVSIGKRLLNHSKKASNSKTIEPVLIEDEISNQTEKASSNGKELDSSIVMSLDEMEKQALINAITIFPKKINVAKQLGISRDTLYRKLRKYGIS
jgi:transcriptional regulator with PAS, ATPase and Fis domain